MREETLFTIKTPYREEVPVKGFFFGSGHKTACFVGSLRGNEIQQMYIASQLIKKLSELESKGMLSPDNEFLVIPCINSFSMNIGKRFWPVDNTDINRMFPGYNQGETTQRIAAAVFEHVKGYKYGIQFASFYLAGDFVPHVRLMHTGYQSPELAKEFGMPFVLCREPTPIDTTTLNYNWQVFETDAYSIYTRETDSIDDSSAKIAIDAVLRFLNAFNFIHCKTFGKWVEFKFEWKKITASALVSPLLYMIALGWGLGSTSSVTDRPYIDFLVPGIIALTTMNTSFSAVGQPLNVQRIFERSFDQIIISPTPMPAYIVGQMLGGSLRGMYSGALILILSIPFGANIQLSISFFLVMLLNGLAFSALGVTAAILARTHGDIARFSSFVILPMTFL